MRVSATVPGVDWRQFSAAVLQTLAWPVTVLAMAVMFRAKLNELLSDRLRKFKAGPVEAEWAESLREAQEAIDSERIVQSGPMPEAVTDERPRPESVATWIGPGAGEPSEANIDATWVGPGADEPSEVAADVTSTGVPQAKPEEPVHQRNLRESPSELNDQWFRIDRHDRSSLVPPAHSALEVRNDALGAFDELRVLAAVSPEAAVVMGGRSLEQAVREYARLVGLADYASVGKLIKILGDNELISHNVLVALERLWGLRNMAAHRKYAIDGERAVEYVETLEDVIRTILAPHTVYQAQVLQALQRLGFPRSRIMVFSSLRELAMVKTSKGIVSFDVKYRIGGLISVADLEQVAKWAVNSNCVLVTNSGLSRAAREYQDMSKNAVEVVIWNGAEDDDALRRALA